MLRFTLELKIIRELGAGAFGRALLVEVPVRQFFAIATPITNSKMFSASVNPSDPDKSICVGSFRPMRRDFRRLRDRRISWIVSKRRAAVFISYIDAGTFV